MADERQSTSAAGGAKGYKRSWKNLLINKRYQLRFTLFMVGVSTILMAGLGIWVMRVADEATRVQGTRVRGDNCPPLNRNGPDTREKDEDVDTDEAAASDDTDTDTPTPVVPADGDDAADGADKDEPPPPAKPEAKADAKKLPGAKTDAAAKPPEPPADEEPEPPACKTDADCGPNKTCRADDGTCHYKIGNIDSEMTYTVPEHFAEEVAVHYECEMRQVGRLQDLERGRANIFWVLIASGLLLTIGLAVYGIKMTHKVAGPLYKITLYMGKMRDGRFDKVYNLRKGDQLVDFYEHFKTAHGGVVDLEKADVAQLKAVIAAADAGEIAGKSPELDAALAEARAILARKEKALE